MGSKLWQACVTGFGKIKQSRNHASIIGGTSLLQIAHEVYSLVLSPADTMYQQLPETCNNSHTWVMSSLKPSRMMHEIQAGLLVLCTYPAHAQVLQPATTAAHNL